MKTTMVIMMFAGATALLAETPRDLTFRGSKIEFSAQSLTAPASQAPMKLQSGELSLAPSFRVVVPPGANDLIAPPGTRREIIRRIQAAGAAKPAVRAPQTTRATTVVPTSGTDLIGTPADRDRIVREVKISDAPPAQPGR